MQEHSSTLAQALCPAFLHFLELPWAPPSPPPLEMLTDQLRAFVGQLWGPEQSQSPAP